MNVEQETALRCAEFWLTMAVEQNLNNPRPEPLAEEYTQRAIKNLMVGSHGVR